MLDHVVGGQALILGMMTLGLCPVTRRQMARPEAKRAPKPPASRPWHSSYPLVIQTSTIFLKAYAFELWGPWDCQIVELTIQGTAWKWRKGIDNKGGKKILNSWKHSKPIAGETQYSSYCLHNTSLQMTSGSKWMWIEVPSCPPASCQGKHVS